MNLVELQKKLIAAARADVPGGQVPYAFEKRITALLASRVAPDNLALWVHGLWRAAVSCIAITLLLGAWAVFNPATGTPTADDLSKNFENTLLASVDQNDQAQ
jgi:hypothetical protein